MQKDQICASYVTKRNSSSKKGRQGTQNSKLFSSHSTPQHQHEATSLFEEFLLHT